MCSGSRDHSHPSEGVSLLFTQRSAGLPVLVEARRSVGSVRHRVHRAPGSPHGPAPRPRPRPALAPRVGGVQLLLEVEKLLRVVGVGADGPGPAHDGGVLVVAVAGKT